MVTFGKASRIARKNSGFTPLSASAIKSLAVSLSDFGLIEDLQEFGGHPVIADFDDVVNGKIPITGGD